MEKQRVREILEAPNLIQVDYAGIPVYIQSVTKDNGTATVFPLDEMDHEQMVEISRLTETVPVSLLFILPSIHFKVCYLIF